MARPIQPDVLSIQELFARPDVHRVPRYQRDYAWSANDEVADLFADFLEAYADFFDSNYFLGQIIVCPSDAPIEDVGSKQLFDLIDGQQRMTTLYLYFLEGLKLVFSQYGGEDPTHEWNPTEKWALNQIYGSLKFPSARDRDSFFPIVVPASPGIPFLLNKVNDGDENFPKTGGPTEERLTAASEFLSRSFVELAAKESWSYVASLLTWVAGNVYLFRLETDSQDEALRHFLRLNDRGLGLEQVDIVKSLLFKNIQDSKELTHEQIDKQWNEASSVVMGARLKRLKSMTSLLKFMIGFRLGKFVASNKGDFSKAWEPYTKKPSEAKKMVAELVPMAYAVVDLSNGLGKSPVPYNPDFTRGTRERSATQQIEILIAADKFSPETFATLLQVVEDRMLLSVWGPEAARDIEPKVHEWSKQIRKINNGDATPELIREIASGWYGEEGFETFARASIDYALNDWSYSIRSHHDRIRYFLARVNQTVNAAFGGMRLPLSDFMKNGSDDLKAYHLDHIFPQSGSVATHWRQSEDLNEELGIASRQAIRIHSIGNLALLYRKDNLEASKELPWTEKKLQIYSGQQLVLPQVLAGPKHVASNWSAKRFEALRGEVASDMSNWNEDSVIGLQTLYRNVVQFDMANTLGIPHKFSDWLNPNS